MEASINEIGALPVCPSDLIGIRSVQGKERIGRDFQPYLMDESKMEGEADCLFFPRTEGEVVAVLRFSREAGSPVFVSGARTGISGSAVPRGGVSLSTERMTTITGLGFHEGRYFLQLEPGVSLRQIEETLSNGRLKIGELTPGAKELFLSEASSYQFPIDPTEKGASIGGMVAANASGSRSFRYGSTRDWVKRLRVVLASGHSLDLIRGRCVASPEGRFRIYMPDGDGIKIRVPRYEISLAKGVKNAAGLYAAPGMDLIDLFIGSEGILGVITLVEIWLTEKRPHMSNVIFFDREEDAIGFVEKLRSDPSLDPGFIESFDDHSLDLLREWQAQDPMSLDLPTLPSYARWAIFFDLPYSEEGLTEQIDRVSNLAMDCGTTLEHSWSAWEEREKARLEKFRHAVPERVNALIAERRRSFPGIHKLGTDMSVPDEKLREMLSFFRDGLEGEGLQYVAFGHIGDNHPHFNILPRNLEELERGKVLFEGFARKVVELGGSVSAEHGIGKLKKGYLRIMYGDQGIREMIEVKEALDPEYLLNPGSMIDMEGRP